MPISCKMLECSIGRCAHSGELWEYEISSHNLKVSLTNFGCSVLRIQARNRAGILDDVVLGYKNIEDYMNDLFYMCCLVGRYSGRINNATYILGNEKIELEKNSFDRHHLHGGPHGLNKRLWQLIESSESDNFVVLGFISPDGDQGHPGELDVQAKFQIKDATLNIDYTVRSNKATHVNLTQHLYFNLCGVNSLQQDAPVPKIDNHELMIHSSSFLETNEQIIPTGRILSTCGTPLDFRNSRKIGHTPLDAYFLLDPLKNGQHCVRLREPVSGRTLSMNTNQPGLQIYTGEYLSSVMKNRDGRELFPRTAICLESQGFPDAPNQPHFPSTLLEAGAKKIYSTSYTFEMDH